MTLQDVRALLRQFQQAGLKDFYWRRGASGLFLARPDGTPNPMLAAPDVQGAATVGTVEQAPPMMVRAPHLGLFEPCCTPGEAVDAGAVVARIDVLGRKTDIVAGAAGRVLALSFAANDLVEYGDCLLELVAA